ncbi:hypothetical protein BpHYR1_002293 [Brachionus plicatilis]|uniref:Uncharacterized protein n=1 Tax=Brachionus plicatilis TaxID=10195 RepID=A0A3M7Q9J7_BRAPC|nr:hypothetical protein BpHYR1_002293 [Brachionus plicatilis]
MFPIECWNVFERVKKRLPRTNYNVENCQGRKQADVRKKLNRIMPKSPFLYFFRNLEPDLHVLQSQDFFKGI